MSFAASWALVGLVSLPVLWWLHVRRKQPPVVDTSSLMFVLDEEERTRLPRGRRFDWELFLTLAGAAFLTLAAAGPRWQTARAHRVVRVVVAGGALATRVDYEPRVTETVASIQRTLEPGDELEVTWIPERDPQGEWRLARRPSLDSLLGTARAGEATVRYIISDQLPTESPADIGWIALGLERDTHAGRDGNVGIVSARVIGEGDQRRVFLVIERTEPDFWLDRAGIQGTETEVSLRRAEGTVLPIEVPLGEATQATVFVMARREKHDSLQADNSVTVTPSRIPVHVEPTLPKDMRDALEAAVHAATQGTAQLVERDQATVVFGTNAAITPAQWFVGLTFPPTDAPPVRMPDGVDRVSSSSWVRELTLHGVAWQFPAVPDPVEDASLLLGRVIEGRTWPVLVRDGERAIRLLAMPPPPSAVFWPLFVENVLDTVGGKPGGGGYRIRGVLDRSVTLVGRDQQPFNPAALRAVPPDRLPAQFDFRVLCLVLGLLAVVLLWFLPAFRPSTDTFAPAYVE